MTDGQRPWQQPGRMPSVPPPLRRSRTPWTVAGVILTVCAVLFLVNLWQDANRWEAHGCSPGLVFAIRYGEPSWDQYCARP